MPQCQDLISSWGYNVIMMKHDQAVIDGVDINKLISVDTSSYNITHIIVDTNSPETT